MLRINRIWSLISAWVAGSRHKAGCVELCQDLWTSSNLKLSVEPEYLNTPVLHSVVERGFGLDSTASRWSSAATAFRELCDQQTIRLEHLVEAQARQAEDSQQSLLDCYTESSNRTTKRPSRSMNDRYALNWAEASDLTVDLITDFLDDFKTGCLGLDLYKSGFRGK
jgi:hypothetical protein